jgi:hypothetical protein
MQSTETAGELFIQAGRQKVPVSDKKRQNLPSAPPLRNLFGRFQAAGPAKHADKAHDRKNLHSV